MSDENTELPLPRLAPFEWLLFEYLVDLAKNNLSCPKNQIIKEKGYAAERISFLAHARYIEIVKHPKSLRVIRILHGEHTGAETAGPKEINLTPIKRQKPSGLEIPDWTKK